MKKCLKLATIALFLSGGLSPVFANQLVYTPVNPSFGGNPLVASWLLDSARIQNDFGAAAGSGDTSGGGSAPTVNAGSNIGGPTIIINPTVGDPGTPVVSP